MSRVRLNNGTSWPDPFAEDFGETGWTLRNGAPTKEQLLFAADVLSAYRDLVLKPNGARNHAANAIKRTCGNAAEE